MVSIILTPVAGVKYYFLFYLSFYYFFFLFFQNFLEESGYMIHGEADNFDSEDYDLGFLTLGSFIERP